MPVTELVELLVLPGASPWVTLLLCAVGVFTAFLTAALGAGGGLLLLGAMTLFLPVASVIPLHGAIQFGAAASRTVLLLRHVRLPLLFAFTIGALAGAAGGAQVLIRLPEAWLQLVLGLFIVWLAWIPLPRLRSTSTAALAAAGMVTTAMTLFVGATGPLVSAFMQALRLERLEHVGTFSAGMLIQHGLKIGVFAFAGFAFGPYLPFLALMLLCTLAGSWLGRAALVRLDDERFHRILAVILTVLAMRLLYSGATGLWN